MDLLQQMKSLAIRMASVETEFARMIKKFDRILKKDIKDDSVLMSGSYFAKCEMQHNQETGVFRMAIHFSDRRVVREEFYDLEKYTKIFKRDLKNPELFLSHYGIDVFNPEHVANVRYEVKVISGGNSGQIGTIKELHAVGVWPAGEFIDLHKEDNQ